MGKLRSAIARISFYFAVRRAERELVVARADAEIRLLGAMRGVRG